MNERRAIKVTGTVQGVGFRPFVHHLAAQLKLHGFVRNQSDAVLIEVEGEQPALEQFLDELVRQTPPLARIDRVLWQRAECVGEDGFRIEASELNPSLAPVCIAADVATCPDCLAELFDPADRRYRYPFLNCTNCGPRLTIVTDAPYDRQRTTMKAFAMCAECQSEYEDPCDRRFHAQPIACPACGPQLQLLDSHGHAVATRDPLAEFARMLREGKIGALKGIGGYHLVCDAAEDSVVGELRQRKHREQKPLAIMVADLETAARLGHVSAIEREMLSSPARPIVLLRKRAASRSCEANLRVAEAVAPGVGHLGVMLPYSPLHHLLLAEDKSRALVMTSGNRSDEPLVYRDEEARQRLQGIADVFLTHNRPIHRACDDSVIRVVANQPLPLRRSRGYVPQPIPLPHSCPFPILALGGQLKATFALGKDSQAFLSQHLGDLDHYEACRAYEREIAHFEQLLQVGPECLVHDLHPDYVSTSYAMRRASMQRLDPTRVIRVQHHHAHMASCMAEHALTGTVIGVTFDGTGLGTDRTIWGGEFLVGDYSGFRRAGHLRYVGMPGAEQAIREPWRMAAAHLLDAGLATEQLALRVPPASLRTVSTMLARRVNTPWTSSAGRLFDAVAAILGVRDQVAYEGQAAMELEALAMESAADEPYPFELSQDASPDRSSDSPRVIVDTRPLIRAVAADAPYLDPPRIARRFHRTLAEIIVSVCQQIRERTNLETVVLSGGVFLNALLTCDVVVRLKEEGFDVYRHRLVPPNDGGLSLGQVAIAASILQQRMS